MKSDEKRNFVLSVRLSDEELKQLRFLAESCKCSESELIRRLIRIFSK